MVSQCGAGAWLNGLASGDQRRLMGSGGASVAFSRQCAIQIDRYFTNLVTFTLLRPTIRSYAIVHGRNLDLELEAFGYYFHPFTVIDNLIYIYIYQESADRRKACGCACSSVGLCDRLYRVHCMLMIVRSSQRLR